MTITQKSSLDRTVMPFSNDPGSDAPATLRKVLVVDDSEILQKLYRVFLNKYPGCQVIPCGNGREAVTQLAVVQDIDLIILDINMPVMNGFGFLRYIRERKFYRHIPVIVISTVDKENDIRQGLSLGARGYLVKPFKADAFHSLIQKVLEQKKGDSQSA